MVFKITLILLALHTVSSQQPSPCPDILVYDGKSKEMDRWYGVITLSSREQLTGIWLRIILDRPAELLGNVFGDATSTDNREFLIKNQNYVLETRTTTPIRFFVKYNAASIVPSVTDINLNGRSICSSTTSANEQPTQRNPIVQTRPTSGGSNTRRTTNTRPTTGSSNSLNNGVTATNSRPTSSSSNDARPVAAPTNSRPNRPASRPTSSSNNFNTDSFYIDSNANTRPSSRPSSSSLSNRPTSSSSNINSNPDMYNENRPSSSNNYNTDSDTYNNRPSSSNNYNTDSDTYNNRPSNSNNRPSNSNNYNPGYDNSDGNGYNQNGNNNKRPVDTFGNDRGTGSGLSANTDNSEEFFAGDFSSTGIRPLSNAPKRPSTNRNQQCGTVASQPRPLISNGQNTTPGQWPWHAALYHSKGIQLMYTCGGTLISTSHILTAAHCVTKPHTNRAINPQNILAYLGKYNLKKFGSEIQDKEVGDIYVHPEYNYTVYYNDIAILRLAEPAEITSFVRPVCLWEDVDDLNEVEGRFGTVVGWGFDHNRQLSNTLMQAQMPIVSTVKCIYSNREFYSQFTSEKSFCAGFRNGTSVCNGDSGGGMVFPKRGTSGSNSVWQIRGLVSVGVALQGQGLCDPSQYIVFTDVAKHIDWIEQILVSNP